MKIKCRTSSRRCVRPAMTLVEVIASLALLGSLLGASVIAQARLARQWNAAQHRVAAAEALDAQMQVWSALEHRPNGGLADTEAETVQPATPHISGEGPLATEPWWWRAEPLQDQPGATWGITLIRYTAFDPSDPERDAVATFDVFRYSPPPPPPEAEAEAEGAALSSARISALISDGGGR